MQQKDKKKYEAGRGTEKEVRGRAKCKGTGKELRGRAKNQEFEWKKGGKAVRGRAKKQRFFEKKNQKKKLTEANGRCNNGPVLAGDRFLTRKLATCSRYTVKTNAKRPRQYPRSSTIIFIKKQQHSTTTLFRNRYSNAPRSIASDAYAI